MTRTCTVPARLNMGRGDMHSQALSELEAWLATLDPPRFPTEAEIEVWDWFYDVALLETQLRAQRSRPPEGGDVLDLFCVQESGTPA